MFRWSQTCAFIQLVLMASMREAILVGIHYSDYFVRFIRVTNFTKPQKYNKNALNAKLHAFNNWFL